MQANDEGLAFEASSSSSSSGEAGSKKSDIRIDLSQSQAVEPLVERRRSKMTSLESKPNGGSTFQAIMESYGSTFPNGSRSSGKTEDYALSQTSAGGRKQTAFSQ